MSGLANDMMVVQFRQSMSAKWFVEIEGITLGELLEINSDGQISGKALDHLQQTGLAMVDGGTAGKVLLIALAL